MCSASPPGGAGIAKHNRSVPKDQRINVEETIRAYVEQPDLYREGDQGGEAAEQQSPSSIA